MSAAPPLSEHVLDLLRWGHLTLVVPSLPARWPRAMRWASQGLELPYRLTFGRRHGPILREELQRCSPTPLPRRELDALVRRALSHQVRVSLEEAVLPRLSSEQLDRRCAVRGREHLDEALARGRGAVMAFLHLGQHWYLPVWCGHHGYRWNQVAAAGRPPADKWQPSWFGRQVFDTRDAWFRALPVTFLPLDTPNRVLVRALQRGELVGIAVDGRIGTRFERVRFLGREARISPGAAKLARAAGAPIVPCSVVLAPDGQQQITFLPALDPPPPGPVRDAIQALMERLEPFALAHLDHYGAWLQHVRRHLGWDDHPLFVDMDSPLR